MTDKKALKRRYYTSEELAVIYMVKPRTIAKWAREKKLLGEKIGKRWLFEIPTFIREAKETK